MLAAASMTAFQDAQATEWRDVAIGEIPEAIIKRDVRGTFTRSVTITFGLSIVIMLLVRGNTSVAIPFYGVGVFLPIMIMGPAVRRHVLEHFTGGARTIGATASMFAAVLAGVVFVGQIVGKWEEGGWARLLTFTTLFLSAHLVLLSPAGYRGAKQVSRIVHEKARVEGGMASIVKWQAYKMQEYRYRLMIGLTGFMEFFGIGQMSRRTVAALAGGGSVRMSQFISSTMNQSMSTARIAPVSNPKEQKIVSNPKPDNYYLLPPRIVRHRILVPISEINQGTLTALRYAHSLSDDVTALHVAMNAEETRKLQSDWATWGDGVRLVVLESPHKMVLEPLLLYIQKLMGIRQENEIITVVVPQSIEPRWWSNLARTQMAVLLRLALPFETGIVITDVPYAIESEK